MSSLEVLFGRNRMEQIYYRLKDRGLSVQSFFAAALEETQIDVQFDAGKLESIPKTGPLMFVANHPFGVVDGIVLCDLALRVRGEIRIMINSLLCQDKDLAPYFLPIDFEPTKKAVATNIRSKQLALEFLSQDIPVLIFPSGMVSTAGGLVLVRLSMRHGQPLRPKSSGKPRQLSFPFFFTGPTVEISCCFAPCRATSYGAADS